MSFVLGLSPASKSIQRRYRINQLIKISPVRVIDEKGGNLGIIPTSEGLRLAGERGLDLIEISPSARPPVCKIMDFGKFKYERERGEREHTKKQKYAEVKSIRIGFSTGKHDLELRARQADKFLGDGDKVRIQMKLMGRQKAHGPLAMQRFHEFLAMIQTPHDLELAPQRTPQGILATVKKA